MDASKITAAQIIRFMESKEGDKALLMREWKALSDDEKMSFKQMFLDHCTLKGLDPATYLAK